MHTAWNAGRKVLKDGEEYGSRMFRRCQKGQGRIQNGMPCFVPLGRPGNGDNNKGTGDGPRTPRIQLIWSGKRGELNLYRTSHIYANFIVMYL